MAVVERARTDLVAIHSFAHTPTDAHNCRHPDAVDDRALCVTYRRDVEPSAALVLPLGARLHGLRRSLVAELRRAEPDGTALDELCLDLLALTRQAADSPRRMGLPRGRSSPACAQRPTPPTSTRHWILSLRPPRGA
jgi:hypothetical protein